MNRRTTFILSLITFLLLTGCSKNDNKPEYREELDNDKKEVLAISSYSNYAWSVQENKTVIFNDGTIYYWDFNGSIEDIIDLDKGNTKVFMLENGKKLDIKVTNKDLEKIEKEIKNVEKIDGQKCLGADQGTHGIYVVKNGKEIAIEITGDCESKDKKYENIVNIIKKYVR